MSGKILITGATGFLGGRLIEKLVAEGKRDIRVILRNFAKAARIGRFDVQMVQGSLTDAAAVAAAVEGCDVVYHCAHDFTDPELNIKVAEILGQTCLAAKVKRLVFVSSFTVYQDFPDGPLTEESPSEPNGRPGLEWRYQDAKIAVERTFLELHARDGLPVTILQPTIIYGPFGGYWTTGMVAFLREGQVNLPDGEDGICNAVYVDDVIDAMIAASQAEAAVGQRMIIGAEQGVGWREYFAAYERLTGTNSVRLRPPEQLRRLSRQSREARVLRALGEAPVRTVGLLGAKLAIQPLRPALREPFSRRLDRFNCPWKQFVPDAQQLALFQARPLVSIAKARNLVGYAPKYTFGSGMKRTARFLRWAER